MKVKIMLVAFRDAGFFEFDYPCDGCDPHDICEYVFAFTNAPGEFLTLEQQRLAQEYRSHGLRSVSVNDQVEINGVTYNCESCGWKAVA